MRGCFLRGCFLLLLVRASVLARTSAARAADAAGDSLLLSAHMGLEAPVAISGLDRGVFLTAGPNAELHFAVQAEGGGAADVAVLLQVSGRVANSARTEDEARLLLPQDSPRSMMLATHYDAKENVFRAESSAEDIVQILMLPPTGEGPVVTAEVIAGKNSRHVIGTISFVNVSTPAVHNRRTTVVYNPAAGDYSLVTRGAARWHALPEIKHRLPPLQSGALTARSLVFGGAALALPPLVFLYGISLLGLTHSLQCRLDKEFFCLNGVVWVMATLLVLYWAVLDFLSFVWLCLWILPLAILVEQSGIRSYAAQGRLAP